MNILNDSFVQRNYVYEYIIVYMNIDIRIIWDGLRNISIGFELYMNQ